MKAILVTFLCILSSLSVAYAGNTEWAYFQDKVGAETIETIANKEFIPFSNDLNRGSNNGIYWLKVTTSDEQELISLNNAQLEKVLCYVDGVAVKEPSKSLYPYYNIGSSTTAYVKVNFAWEAHLQVSSGNEESYLNSLQMNIAINSFYLGCVLMVVLIHIFYFFTFKEITFILYAIAAFTVAMNVAVLDGMFRFMLPNDSGLIYMVLIIGNISAVVAAWFAYTYLNVKPHLPRVKYVYISLIGLMVALNLVCVLTGNIVYWIFANIMGLGLYTLSFCLSIYLWKKNKFAKYYTIAYGAIIIFGVNLFINPLLAIPEFNFAGALFKFAVIFEMSIFTYALVFRMKVLKGENEAMEKSIYDYVTQTASLESELEKLKKGEENSLISESDLTSREVEILTLIAEGKSNKEIGNDLNISVNTVKYHTKKLYDRLDIKSRQEVRKKLVGWNKVGK